MLLLSRWGFISHKNGSKAASNTISHIYGASPPLNFIVHFPLPAALIRGNYFDVKAIQRIATGSSTMPYPWRHSRAEFNTLPASVPLRAAGLASYGAHISFSLMIILYASRAHMLFIEDARFKFIHGTASLHIYHFARLRCINYVTTYFRRSKHRWEMPAYGRPDIWWPAPRSLRVAGARW